MYHGVFRENIGGHDVWFTVRRDFVHNQDRTALVETDYYGMVTFTEPGAMGLGEMVRQNGNPVFRDSVEAMLEAAREFVHQKWNI